MKEELRALKEKALSEVKMADSLELLKELRIKYLGRKGPMTEILRGMGKLMPNERPQIGQIVNEIKNILETEINKKTVFWEQKALEDKLSNEKVDI
ncbi:MAG: phenylalanine--tRNA ligase subunit alpha, partial [Phascolarctobacterium sp.]|nr:phenylalanine--tRNA ligase subunit alpha [Phascolarctobacterium sp.]